LTQTEMKPSRRSRAKKPVSMKTHIIFIIDESGSMLDTASDVRGGFNAYVEKLKGDGNDYTLTAIKFGTTVRPLFANLALEDVPQLTPENYTPLDSTALYDAIGHGLDAAKEKWGTEKKPYGKERVFFIIMTDGFENASRKFSKENIAARMKRREEAGNWTFVYLGADQDAWAIASTLGFAQGNVMAYASADAGPMFSNLATSTTTSATSTATQSRTFFNP
jgi:uncharacterized protein YegL